MEYYPAIKRNAFVSILMRWMNQEPVTHSEAIQREKKLMSHINAYTWTREKWY